MQKIQTNIALEIMPLRFHFKTDRRFEMPGYPGSAWRGAFGHALKRTVCVNRGARCETCLFYRSCAYPYLFNTPSPKDSAKMTRYATVPVPYLLTIDADRPESGAVVGLTLIGRALRHLPYVVHAMNLAGQQGIGPVRQELTLSQVMQLDFESSNWIEIYRPNQALQVQSAAPPRIPEIPAQIEIHLPIPLRLKHDDHLVTPESFCFRDLFSALLRRISMLSYFHGEMPLETDFAGVTAAAAQVPIIARELRWKDWTRYSSRQKSAMQMGGIVGRFQLDGKGLDAFWPYLWLGQWLGAGKGVTMGLGHYTIHPASLPNEAIQSLGD